MTENKKSRLQKIEEYQDRMSDVCGSFIENLGYLDDLVTISQIKDWNSVYAEFSENGTNLAINEADPMGDGDQSCIYNSQHARFHSKLWSCGADIPYLATTGQLPLFIWACMHGDPNLCGAMLSSACGVEERKCLLETRYSLLRVSPIFLRP